jgi:hypothetical protein
MRRLIRRRTPPTSAFYQNMESRHYADQAF